MDGHRFDGFARSLVGGPALTKEGVSRRGLLAGLGALAAGWAGLEPARAAKTCPQGQVLAAGKKCVCKTTGHPPVGGICPCPSGKKACAPGGSCVPNSACCTDAECPAAKPFCVGGACAVCPSGMEQCPDGSCIPACGFGGQPTMSNSQCVCQCGIGPCYPSFVCDGPPDYCVCPGGTDVCVTEVNPANWHCAAFCPGNLVCGPFVCWPGSICSGDIHDPASDCLCPPGTVLCVPPQDTTNKTCTPSCLGGLALCGGAVCGDNAVCDQGQCVLCPAGQQRCSTHDPANSVCVPACPGGQTLNHSTCVCA
jgi:hypothetical protein